MTNNYTIATVDITDEDGHLIRVEFRVYDSNNCLLETFDNRADARNYIQSLIDQKPEPPRMGM